MKQFALIVISAILLPLFFIISNVRWLATPTFVAYEYSKPGFPPAEIAVSPQMRQQLANVAVLSIVAPGGIDALQTACLPNGQHAFDQREVRHMADVRALVKKLFLLWWFILLLGTLIAILIHRYGDTNSLSTTLIAGGASTLVLLAITLTIVIFAFEPFFVTFHHIFFQGNSWLFPERSTLIQLFPLTFWSDATLLLSSATAGEGLIAFISGYLWRKKSSTS